MDGGCEVPDDIRSEPSEKTPISLRRGVRRKSEWIVKELQGCETAVRDMLLLGASIACVSSNASSYLLLI